ncbi:hypothetical protein J437_LFUL011194 [Ladona fulva]|uniref:Lipocalin/cytosolic fatty-acid binding domain-containing protein n=1 Tax=Ladona fulva TaxID=123851 RepID=A0A8K0KNT8_LADFU|nr:hypothetical protein J437_LFUL011194 [Ladona fulva]
MDRFLLLVCLLGSSWACPPARPLRHFDIHSILGGWHVVQFYSSGEEGAAPYRCMRANLSLSLPKLQMVFSYVFADDPLRETLLGNLTWDIPEMSNPAHWVHAEDAYDGIYDTFVVDAEASSWALLVHCARNDAIQPLHSPMHNVIGTGQARTRRFISAFILSRQSELAPGALAYLRDKLPPFGVDLEYVSNVEQKGCVGEERREVEETPYEDEQGTVEMRRKAVEEDIREENEWQ